MKRLAIVLAFVLATSFLAAPAGAEEPAAPCPEACPPAPEGLLPVPDYGGCWYRRPQLSGDWGGVRRCWAERGVFLELQWTQVAQGVVDGGLDERWAHTTNLDLRAMFDLTRMGAVPGALVTLRAQSRFGDTVNGDSGLILPVHTYGYFPYTEPLDEEVPIALTELNWLQMVSENLGFLVGKITTMAVANEFASGEGRTQFMNFQFIFPAVFAQVAPYSTLAGGVLWMPSEKVTVSSFLLNTTDASTSTGFDDFDDGQTWWTSATFTWGACSRPGGVTLGAAYAFNGDFARVGGLVIDPPGGLTLATKSESWAAFASAWQYLLVMEEPRAIDPNDGRQDLRGLGVFAILGAGDEDTNPVQASIAAGLSGRGLIPGRCDDTCGLGYFYNELGDVVAEGRVGSRLEENQGVELYYTVALAGSIGLTLDAQWIDTGFELADDAFILGARLNVDF